MEFRLFPQHKLHQGVSMVVLTGSTKNSCFAFLWPGPPDRPIWAPEWGGCRPPTPPGIYCGGSAPHLLRQVGLRPPQIGPKMCGPRRASIGLKPYNLLRLGTYWPMWRLYLDLKKRVLSCSQLRISKMCPSINTLLMMLTCWEFIVCCCVALSASTITFCAVCMDACTAQSMSVQHD